MRKINFFIKAMIVCVMPLATLLSCDKDDSGDVTPKKEYEISGTVTVNALSARISGSFKGIPKVDLSLGKTGVLYCLKSDNAESLFKSWLSGNKEAGCYEYTDGKLTSDTYAGTITNLYPDKEYSYCLFCVAKDGSSYKMSDVFSMRTGKLKPEFKNFKVDSIRYTKAVVKGRISNIDRNDVSVCSSGLLLADGENGEVNADSRTFEVKGVKTDWRVQANELTSDSSYCCRPFIKYITHDTLAHYVYGPSLEVRTWNLDDWAVDLGLSVKWSKCEMGREDFDDFNDLVYGKLFYVRWGSVLDNYYSRNDVGYEYWDVDNRSYINIGNEISGTQYDIAHAKLGGHWRLPTKAEVEELISNCNVTFDEREYQYEYTSGSTTYIVHSFYNFAVLQSKNNNNGIKIRAGSYWTGTLDENQDDYVEEYEGDIYNYEPESQTYYLSVRNSNSTLAGSNFLSVSYAYRDNWMMIRPVWDPNLE